MAVANVKQNEGNQVDSPLNILEPDFIEAVPDFDKLFPDFQDSDLLVIVKTFVNLITIDFSIEHYDPDIKYNKKYFARYYGVDEKTFNKWVEVFCTPKFKERYKPKRRLDIFDWSTIMKTFGQCDQASRRPYTRSEINKLIYHDNCSFSNCKEDLDKYLPKKARSLNIFPPEVVYAFLKHVDAPEIYHAKMYRGKELSIKQKIRIIAKEITRAKNMSEQERYKFKKEVRDFLGLK